MKKLNFALLGCGKLSEYAPYHKKIVFKFIRCAIKKLLKQKDWEKKLL